MDLSYEPPVRTAIPGYPNYFLTPEDGVWSYWEKRVIGTHPWCQLKYTGKERRYKLYNAETGARARATLEELQQAAATGSPLTPVAPPLTLAQRVTMLELRVRVLETPLE